MKAIYLTDDEISEIMYSCKSYSLQKKMETLLLRRGIGILNVKTELESITNKEVVYELEEYQREVLVDHAKYKFVIEVYKRLVEDIKLEVYTYISKWDKLKDFINDLNLPFVPKLTVNKQLDKKYQLEEYILTPPTNDYNSVLRLVTYE